MENIGHALKGRYRDILTEPGRGVIFDSGWNNNTIVDRCRMLLAGFMRSDASSGIQYLAVGQGEESWDSGIPSADPATTFELFNKAADADPPFEHPIAFDDLTFTYLSASEEPIDGPTPRIQISATLPPGVPQPLGGGTTYPLREFGLFGRFTVGSEIEDYMINTIRHPVIHKGPTATLIRVVRLYF